MVTFVVATYNRPDPLRVALRSVRAQRRSDWRVLVIGDACGPATEAVVASFREPRFRYLNLPARMGEQAGPNSVGMALAETPYVALLNHDDVLLPDHLDVALDALGAGADLFAGRAAMAWQVEPHPEHGEKPVFSWHTPRGRTPTDIFTQPNRLFEPVSAWVMRRALAERVGPWRSDRLLYRTPLQDWLLRAWRAGARFAFDGPVTTLMMKTHYLLPPETRPDDWYTRMPTQADWLASVLARDPDAVRRDLAAEMRRTPRDTSHAPGPLARGLQRLGLGPAAAHLYRRTGLDLVALYRRLRYERGAQGQQRSQERTGFDLRDAPPIPDMVRRMVAAHGGRPPQPV